MPNQWGRALLLCGLLHFCIVSSTAMQQKSLKFSVIRCQRMKRGTKATSVSVVKTQTNLSWNFPREWKSWLCWVTPTLWLFNLSKNCLCLNTCILKACVHCLSVGQGPNVSHCHHTCAKQPKSCSGQVNQVRWSRLHPSLKTRDGHQR